MSEFPGNFGKRIDDIRKHDDDQRRFSEEQKAAQQSRLAEVQKDREAMRELMARLGPDIASRAVDKAVPEQVVLCTLTETVKRNFFGIQRVEYAPKPVHNGWLILSGAKTHFNTGPSGYGYREDSREVSLLVLADDGNFHSFHYWQQDFSPSTPVIPEGRLLMRGAKPPEQHFAIQQHSYAVGKIPAMIHGAPILEAALANFVVNNGLDQK